jgi:hypothetical protein
VQVFLPPRITGRSGYPTSFVVTKVSHQVFMAKLVEVALRVIYPVGPAGRLFWIADAIYTEKPYAKQGASTGLFHRTKKVAGRAKHLQGHCYVFAALMYETVTEAGKRWASVLVGALLYVKERSIPTLVEQLAGHLPAQRRAPCVGGG